MYWVSLQLKCEQTNSTWVDCLWFIWKIAVLGLHLQLELFLFVHEQAIDSDAIGRHLGTNFVFFAVAAKPTAHQLRIHFESLLNLLKHASASLLSDDKNATSLLAIDPERFLPCESSGYQDFTCRQGLILGHLLVGRADGHINFAWKELVRCAREERGLWILHLMMSVVA